MSAFQWRPVFISSPVMFSLFSCWTSASGPRITDVPESIEKIFAFCLERNLRLQLEKCSIELTATAWCGRKIVTKDNILNCRQTDGLTKMKLPSTRAHLKEFLCAVYKNEIFRVQETRSASPLTGILYTKKRSRKNSRLLYPA